MALDKEEETKRQLRTLETSQEEQVKCLSGRRHLSACYNMKYLLGLAHHFFYRRKKSLQKCHVTCTPLCRTCCSLISSIVHCVAVQHERAPRGTFKRVFPPDFAAHTSMPLLHPLPSSSSSSSMAANHDNHHHHLLHHNMYNNGGPLPIFPWRAPNFSGAILPVPRQFHFNWLMPNLVPNAHAAAATTAATSATSAAFTHQLFPTSHNSAHRIKDDRSNSGSLARTTTTTTMSASKIHQHQHSPPSEMPSAANGINQHGKENDGKRDHRADLTDPDSAAATAALNHSNWIRSNSAGAQLLASPQRSHRHTSDLSESAIRILFLAIRWARTIPSFSQVSRMRSKELISE